MLHKDMRQMPTANSSAVKNLQKMFTRAMPNISLRRLEKLRKSGMTLNQAGSNGERHNPRKFKTVLKPSITSLSKEVTPQFRN